MSPLLYNLHQQVDPFNKMVRMQGSMPFALVLSTVVEGGRETVKNYRFA